MPSAQPFIGQIELFGSNFPPSGWALCNGQLLVISENDTLFQLIGTTYGGDGQNTFALPNLNSRMALGVGTGQGLSTVTQGQLGGTESVALVAANVPAHSHPLAAQSGRSSTSETGSTVALAQMAEDDGTPARSYSSTAPDTTLSSASIGSVGSSQAVDIRNPYLGLQYAISLFGIFPSPN
jgi:microcystin-dependent protein